MSGELSRKLKTVLDETCLLILGAQVLFGFQFEAVFQEMFTSVGLIGRVINATSLGLFVLTMGWGSTNSSVSVLDANHLGIREVLDNVLTVG
jgi:hypothetical protein